MFPYGHSIKPSPYVMEAGAIVGKGQPSDTCFDTESERERERELESVCVCALAPASRSVQDPTSWAACALIGLEGAPRGSLD